MVRISVNRSQKMRLTSYLRRETVEEYKKGRKIKFWLITVRLEKKKYISKCTFYITLANTVTMSHT